VCVLFQNQIIEFNWNNIKAWEIDEEGICFAFQHNRPDKNARLIKIHTPYVSVHLFIDLAKASFNNTKKVYKESKMYLLLLKIQLFKKALGAFVNVNFVELAKS